MMHSTARSVPVPIKLEAIRERLDELLGERAEVEARHTQLDLEIGVLMVHLVASSKREPRQDRQMAYRLPAAAKLLDVSEDVLRREIAAGKLASHLIGGARVVLAGELEEYLAELPERKEDE